MYKNLIDYEEAIARFDNSIDLYKMLIPYWFEKKQFESSELLTLEKKEDKKACAEYVHAMKGAAKNLGANKLGKAAQHLENLYTGREDGDTSEAIKEVQTLFDATSTALKELQSTL
ncbi:MAG: hypothetical protein BKP49_08570 [Treponema sp. CETP13]|nr:MAG: hypothetical protein BKP49_08570 [Treponema sp. CETP13]